MPEIKVDTSAIQQAAKLTEQTLADLEVATKMLGRCGSGAELTPAAAACEAVAKRAATVVDALRETTSGLSYQLSQAADNYEQANSASTGVSGFASGRAGALGYR